MRGGGYDRGLPIEGERWEGRVHDGRRKGGWGMKVRRSAHLIHRRVGPCLFLTNIYCQPSRLEPLFSFWPSLVLLHPHRLSGPHKKQTTRCGRCSPSSWGAQASQRCCIFEARNALLSDSSGNRAPRHPYLTAPASRPTHSSIPGLSLRRGR